MKSAIVVLAIIVPFVVGAYISGFYPVVIVGGTPIMARTWLKAEQGAEHFTNAQAKLAPEGKEIDFSLPANREFLLEIQRGTLTFLIEDMIMQQEGDTVAADYFLDVTDKIKDALSRMEDLDKKVDRMYGFSIEDFKKFVLVPQARQDVIRAALVSRRQTFEEWIREEKKKKKVRLFFVPYRWDGEFVR